VTGALFGPFLRAIGGAPVERGVATGAIGRIAEQINRSTGTGWRWHRKARAVCVLTGAAALPYCPYANVPLACAYFDFRKNASV
jgi:hypothetical protein